MFQAHLSKAFGSRFPIFSLSSLLVFIPVAPSLAVPEIQLDSAAPLEQVDAQTASDLGAPLEMNCETATRLNLPLFYQSVDGKEVPVDCLSLLRPSGADYPLESTGFGDFNLLPDVADRVNETLISPRNSSSIQLPLIRVEF